IAESGRAAYHFTPGPDGAPDPRLAQFYRNVLSTRAPAGYSFSETPDGVMHLTRTGDAGPQRNFQAAVRDPETGEVYTGLDHEEAIAAAPDDVQPRLRALYEGTEDPENVGFQVNGQFMGREEG